MVSAFNTSSAAFNNRDAIFVKEKMSGSCFSSQKMSDQDFVRRHVDYLNELEKMGYKQKSFSYLIRNRPITAEEQAIIADRIDKKGKDKGDDDVDLKLGDGPGITITKNELRRLSGTGDPPHNTLWLNDAVIDLYCYLCCKRDPASTVFVFYTQFYMNLMGGGGKYDYLRAGEIFNKRGRTKAQVDILKQRALLIPVNINNTHWILCFVDMYYKCLYALDSLLGVDTAVVLGNILRYLEDEFRYKKKIVLNRSEWTVRPADTNSTPQQPNSYDCGVYTCMFANVLTAYFDRQAKAKEFRRVDMEIFDVIRASDMPRVRQQIQLDLLSGVVYSRPPD